MRCRRGDKTHFPTELDAANRLEEITASPDAWRDHNPTRVYECPCGGGWTLTSVGIDWTAAHQEERRRLRRHRR